MIDESAIRQRFEALAPVLNERGLRRLAAAEAKPLVSHQVIVQLIAATTTKTGLEVRCELDPTTYPAAVKISDDELAAVNIVRHDFHGEWNYTISPKAKTLQQ